MNVICEKSDIYTQTKHYNNLQMQRLR